MFLLTHSLKLSLIHQASFSLVNFLSQSSIFLLILKLPFSLIHLLSHSLTPFLNHQFSFSLTRFESHSLRTALYKDKKATQKHEDQKHTLTPLVVNIFFLPKSQTTNASKYVGMTTVLLKRSTVKPSLVDELIFGMFVKAMKLGLCTIVMLNVAFIAGSSKQGNALRASVG